MVAEKWIISLIKELDLALDTSNTKDISESWQTPFRSLSDNISSWSAVLIKIISSIDTNSSNSLMYFIDEK